MAEERARCPGGCGQLIEESHDRKTAGKWRVDTIVCQACLVQQAQMNSDRDNESTRGRLYSVSRSRR